MHDLRAAVYRHLQRLSLAFFTRTRTGEVQSRIANDIGGLDSVVTTTATTIAQNATTVIATIVAMCLLDWRAGGDLARVRAAVRVDDAAGRQGPPEDHDGAAASTGRHLGAGAGVAVGLGDHARQDDGARVDLADRFTGESQDRLADLEVRSRMAGRWVMATIQMTFAIQPAIIYWLGGFETLDSAHPITIGTLGRVHDPADPAAVPDPVPARRRRSTCRGLAGAV